jgi:glycosyltransferase involved in cell wall biosynthesis
MAQKSSPTIDVIIPVYNTEAYIIEALKSIEKQTYPVHKVFVINDASTDKSREKILAYKSTSNLSIEYIELSKNRGPAHARNVGIKLSSAKFLSFHDADDTITPDKIERQIKYMTENPKVLLTHTNFIYTDESGKHIETSIHNRRKGVPLHGDVRKSIFYNIFYLSAPTVIVARTALDQVGLFDENMRYGEDMDMWIKISKISNFGYIPEICLYMRRHATNTTNYLDKMFEGLFPFYNKWLMEFPDDTPVVKGVKISIPYYAFKAKSHRKFIEKELKPDLKVKLFPFGSLSNAIITSIPWWIVKFIKKRLWKFSP